VARPIQVVELEELEEVHLRAGLKDHGSAVAGHVRLLLAVRDGEAEVVCGAVDVRALGFLDCPIPFLQMGLQPLEPLALGSFSGCELAVGFLVRENGHRTGRLAAPKGSLLCKPFQPLDGELRRLVGREVLCGTDLGEIEPLVLFRKAEVFRHR